MSKLNDCAGKLRQLLKEVERTEAAYQQALNLLKALDAGQHVDISGLGMKLTFEDGTEVPVPVASSPEELTDVAARAVNFIGNDLGRLWTAIHEVAGEATQHFDEAVARAKQQAVNVLPGVDSLPQPGVKLTPGVDSSPQPAAALVNPEPKGQEAVAGPAAVAGPQAPVVPRLSPVTTTDVTDQKR